MRPGGAELKLEMSCANVERDKSIDGCLTLGFLLRVCSLVQGTVVGRFPLDFVTRFYFSKYARDMSIVSPPQHFRHSDYTLVVPIRITLVLHKVAVGANQGPVIRILAVFPIRQGLGNILPGW